MWVDGCPGPKCELPDDDVALGFRVIIRGVPVEPGAATATSFDAVGTITSTILSVSSY